MINARISREFAAVKEDRLIEEKCSALFQIFRQEIQSELKSEILELRTEIEKLKVSLVESRLKKPLQVRAVIRLR